MTKRVIINNLRNYCRFRQAPYYNQEQHIIKPPYGKQNLPSLFLWSPLQSFNVEIICPRHSVPLSVGMWTDDLTWLHQKVSRMQGLFMMFSVIFYLLINFARAILKTIQVTVICRQAQGF